MTYSLLIFTDFLFAVSLGGFVTAWSRPSSSWERTANYFLDLGFLVLSAIVFLEAVRSGVFVPVANRFQAMIFSAWSLVLMFLFVRRGHSRTSFSLILIPLVMLVLTIALGQDSNVLLIPEAYVTDELFAVHTLAGFFAYANFALSFVASTVYLLQNWVLKRRKGGKFYQQLPTLEALEHTVYFTVSLGVPLLAVTLVTGFFWSKQAFGHFWLWDLKVIFATCTWLLYVFLLYMRFVRSFRGTRVMVYSFLSFTFMIVTLLGTSSFQQQVHFVL